MELGTGIEPMSTDYHSAILPIELTQLKRLFGGQECYDKEQEIIKEYSEYKYSGDNLLKNGNSELFSKDILLLDSDGTLTPTPTGNLSDRNRALYAVEL